MLKRQVSLILVMAMVLSLVTGMTSFAEESTAQETQQENSTEKADETKVDETTVDKTEKSSVSGEVTLDYIAVTNPRVDSPGSQDIIAGFSEGASLEDAVLTYVNETTGEEKTITPLEWVNDTAHYVMDFPEGSPAGTYRLIKLNVMKEGVDTDILLSDLGIESRFGVNQDCETTPDDVVEADQMAAEAEEVIDPELFDTNAEVTTATMDESGEVSAQTLEESLTQEIQSTAMQTRTGRAGEVVIVLDPGHGGSDSGASNKTYGAKEKDLVLTIANAVKSELSQYYGVRVEMTRTTDVLLGSNISEDLKARPEIAKSKGANLFVSLHLNAFNGSAKGAEVYYASGSPSPSQSVSQSVQDALVSLGLGNRGVKTAEYVVLTGCRNYGIPALLIESAFIDNDNEYLTYLNSTAKLNSIGTKIGSSIANSLGLLKGQWKQSGKNWMFQFKNGSYAKNQWLYVVNGWYYFNGSGYMLTGWQTIGSDRYHFDSSGMMSSKWKFIDNKWYYFDKDSGKLLKNNWLWDTDYNKWLYLDGNGVMVKGWKKIGSYSYYFNDSGYMLSGKVTIGGKEYNIPSHGGLKSGWVQDSTGTWYYYSEKDLLAAKGFQTINKVVYYFDSNGKMAVGWKLISQKWYYFNGSGAMQKNWLLQGRTWYQLGSDGKMKTGWYTEGTTKYYLDSNSGGMITGWKFIDKNWYYFAPWGGMAKNSWVFDGVWYAVDKDGKMRTGWFQEGSTYYYLNSSGRMLTGTQTISGKTYVFNSSGALTSGTPETGMKPSEDSNNENGWVLDGKTWYYYTNGKKATGWKWIGTDWFYFNGSGKMLTGWIWVGDKWYYMESSGRMKTGWQFISGEWYNLDGNGAMRIGWYKEGNAWYYLHGSGVMQRGWYTEGSKKYYLDSSSGVMATTWKKISGKWYYFDLDLGGAMKTGWRKIGSTWYYMNNNGVMVTGWLQEGGWYYFNNSGGMEKGWVKDGSYYYMSPSKNGVYAEGQMMLGYQHIDGTWYFLNNTQSPLGANTYTGVTPIMGGTQKGDVVNWMVNQYKSSGVSYPGTALSKGGASTITQFAQIIKEEAEREGVRPEVVFAQAMVETGWLKFGGQVSIDQYNFSGLGATDDGAAGAGFTDVREGIRAQVQHLVAYASSKNLTTTCVDPRFHLVTREAAPYIEFLGTKENPKGYGWATGARYGFKLMDIINK
ncbi:glucan-binding repeat-containing protein [Aequitasia blattaphilus]|uniref:N-acetylmuramoyl-L-alanine amidase n=1 Tax=Aequitasia blattaphilus TaxID=2949332 RepID=A0ABT1E6A1_9FIRM|nr:N-acetylmuramoyl-L-alanine amidase [Aequitasia blattaphilus]MCP1101374.1 N-acetylmuramoyl-L-alanine amidase [Aequitasia blattaphilus]MCR8614014.1 N-acetylmuramoyl-L-alanine amidase [Aequitasia blattaphilus]